MEEVWYNQPQHTPLSLPEVELFWNTRGRAVEVMDKSKVGELLARGFIRCEKDVKTGEYNPSFDKGGLVGSQHVVESTNKSGLHLTLV